MFMKGGPDGTGYDYSKSGLFDQRTFERWFFDIFLPYAQSMDGKKILIAENLSSHFSIEVVQACAEYDIAFVSLLPNATHLLQPLDVAVFGPPKRIWHSVLEDWRVDHFQENTIVKFCTCACHDIIRRPLQITCQNYFCLKCILPALEGKPIDETKCPRCDDNNITPENIIPSKYIQNMLVELAAQKQQQDPCSEIMSPSMTPSKKGKKGLTIFV